MSSPYPSNMRGPDFNKWLGADAMVVETRLLLASLDDTAQGPDLSKWDGGPDDNLQVANFDLMKAFADFAIVKVCEWSNKDRLFDRMWGAAKGREARSAYTFFHQGQNQKNEVAKVMGWLGSDPGELPVSLDVEVDDGSPGNVLTQMSVWAGEYNRLTSLWPMIYSTNSLLFGWGCAQKKVDGTPKWPFLANCMYWCAEYHYDNPQPLPGYTQTGDALRAILIQEVIDGRRQLTWPKPVEPFRAVDFFQWTSRYPPEQIPGYYVGPNHKDAVDMNVSRLSRDAFKAAYPVAGQPPPQPADNSLSFTAELTIQKE